MKRKTKNLTLSALFAVLALTLLFIAAVSPVSQLGLSAAASLFTAAAVIECGYGYGTAVYVITCVLGWILLPNKGPVLMYFVFLGYYPIIKSYAERLTNVVFMWAVKLILFVAALTVMRFLLSAVIFGFDVGNINSIFLYAAGIMIFVLFDMGLSKLIMFYLSRISLNKK